MYRIFYAEKDTTLYENLSKQEQNTGIDSILELTKIPSNSILNNDLQPDTYNSRILLDFKTDNINFDNLTIDVSCFEDDVFIINQERVSNFITAYKHLLK